MSCRPAAHYLPAWEVNELNCHGGPRLSKSVHVGTRKMVNYA